MRASPCPDRPPAPGPGVPLRRSARLAALALCLAALGAAGALLFYPHLTASYHIRQARRALEQDDFALAVEHLRGALAAQEGSAEAHFLLARTCRRAGDADAARAHLERGRALGWDRDQVRLEELLQEAQSGMVAPVEEVLQRYLGAGIEERLVLEALARGCLQSNLTERAYSYTRRWVDRYPDDWYGRFWHGRALEQGLRYDLAAEAYRAVLERNPEYVEANLHCGQVLLWPGRYPEALLYFEAVVRRQPANEAALLGLAQCQRSVRPPEEARATLGRLLALPGEHPAGWLLLGQLELDADRPAEALPWLERAVRQTPLDRDANQALATALRWLDRPAEAEPYERRKQEVERDLHRMDELIKASLAKPRDASLRYEAGTTLVRLGQDGEAVRWFVSALVLDPRNQATRQALAGCIDRLGDPQLAGAYRPILEERKKE
jgi:tetratricopeptide (TPR) repeat protein